MEEYAKAMLKAACLQAAAILVANSGQATDSRRGFGPTQSAPNTAACVSYARDLFGKLTNEKWD
jgi:hypothetical protein